MKYIATIFLAIALLSAHAMRDESEEDGRADEEAISRIVLDSTLSEALANLRAKRARGRTMGCEDTSPLETEGLPNTWTKELDFTSAKCVGDGAYGRVFLVKATCNRTFSLAVKEQNFERSKNAAKAQASMQSEAEVMRRIKDRHIVTHHDDKLVGSRGYILMEALPGGELLDTLAESAVNLTHKLALFAEALSGVVRIHKLGFAHVDLKPENIFLTAKCTTGACHAKVGDFGFACKPEPNPDGVCKKSAGTPGYAAPEVYYGEVGQKSDVWSMGITLYKTLNGLSKTPVMPCKLGDKWLLQNRLMVDWDTYTVKLLEGRTDIPKGKALLDLYDGNVAQCVAKSTEPITIPNEAQQTKEGKAFKDLLLRMLQKDPRQRCTAQEALNQFKDVAKGIDGLKEHILVDYADTAALPTCMGPLEKADPEPSAKADPEPEAKSKKAAKQSNRLLGGWAERLCGGSPCPKS